MENFSILILALVSAAAIATISKLLLRRRNPPPGPKPWPIIGNINLMGSASHKSLQSLAQKYGEIMHLKFGSIPVVIASSPEMAKQFFKVHDANFASRPALAAGRHTAYNYSDMLWAPLGPYFKQARKIFLAEAFSAKKLEFLEPIRVEERRKFLSRLHSLSGKPVLVKKHLKRYVLSIIWRMTYGDTEEESAYNLEQEQVQQILDEWIEVNGFVNIGDWIPWLRFLDLQGYVKRMKEVGEKLERFHNYVIDHHLSKSTHGNEEISWKGILVALLKLGQDPNLEVQLTRDSIKGLSQDLLIGGTDTASGTVEWAIHAIMRHPRVIDKAKQELDQVIGRSRWVEESDLPQLPYINAIIKETMRLYPLNLLLPPHYAIDDCKVAGYDISKGTVVIVNNYNLGRDPNSWDSPEEFLPERFLAKEIDLTGGNYVILPFGSGRRLCPGYKLGLKIVGSALANLLHGFDMRLIQGMEPEDICLDPDNGLTVHPQRPISIIMEPALPPHLY